MNGTLIAVVIIGLITGINLWDRHKKKHVAPQRGANHSSVIESGVKLSGGKAAKVPERSLEAINAAIRRKMGAVQFCYKKEIRKKPGLVAE